MLLARFMSSRTWANGKISKADRESMITGGGGKGINFYDQTTPISINFLLTNNPRLNKFPTTYSNPCIVDYLDKLHIRHIIGPDNGIDHTPRTKKAINEFYMACRQTGALLYGYLSEDEVNI
jgi:hypothetical protein